MNVEIRILADFDQIADYVRFDTFNVCQWCKVKTCHGYDMGINHTPHWLCLSCNFKYRTQYRDFDAERVIPLMKKYLEDNPEYALEE